MKIVDTEHKFLLPLRNFLERYSDPSEQPMSNLGTFYDNPDVRQIRSYHGICWVTNKPREGRQCDEKSFEGLGLPILLICDELRDWLSVTRIRNTSPRVRYTGVVCGNVGAEAPSAQQDMI